MNITRFEYMLALERSGTISKAAEEFFISPSAISQCLKTEEKELGVQLFERNNGKIVPTQAGQIYLKGARSILEIQKRTMEQLHSPAKSTSRIRIFMSPMLFEPTAAPLRQALELAFPNMEIQMAQTDERTACAYLLNDLADFALLASPPQHHTMLSEETLGNDQLLLVVPRAYLRYKITAEPQLEDCSTIPFILTKTGSSCRNLENAILARHHLSQIRIYETEHYLMSKQFLEDGRGAAFLPASLLPADAGQRYYIIPPKASGRLPFLLVSPRCKNGNLDSGKIMDIIRRTWKNTCFSTPLPPTSPRP